MTQAYHTPLTTFSISTVHRPPHHLIQRPKPLPNPTPTLFPLLYTEYILTLLPTTISPPPSSTFPILPFLTVIIYCQEKMLMLRTPLFSTTTAATATAFPVTSNRTGLRIGRVRRVVAAVQEGGPMTGIVFQPFEEVKSDHLVVPISSQASLARQKFVDECESATNEQINVEYSASYVYHSLFAYFDRDNVALKGFAKSFKESSQEERGHADKLMEYQNMRGGTVKLHSILIPLSEFEHPEKGDALHAMELALSLEKLVNEKLLNLHSVAEKNSDLHLQDFVEGGFLQEQVNAIKKISEYITQLRMVGKGHGVWLFDQMLLNQGN